MEITLQFTIYNLPASSKHITTHDIIPNDDIENVGKRGGFLKFELHQRKQFSRLKSWEFGGTPEKQCCRRATLILPSYSFNHAPHMWNEVARCVLQFWKVHFVYLTNSKHDMNLFTDRNASQNECWQNVLKQRVYRPYEIA